MTPADNPYPGIAAAQAVCAAADWAYLQRLRRAVRNDPPPPPPADPIDPRNTALQETSNS